MYGAHCLSCWFLWFLDVCKLKEYNIPGMSISIVMHSYPLQLSHRYETNLRRKEEIDPVKPNFYRSKRYSLSPQLVFSRFILKMDKPAKLCHHLLLWVFFQNSVKYGKRSYIANDRLRDRDLMLSKSAYDTELLDSDDSFVSQGPLGTNNDETVQVIFCTQ